MAKPLIYTIDDDASMNLLMEARFTKFGCDIKTFTEPKMLIDAIIARKPKLVIVDLNLGEGMSGFDIIETIRDELKLEFPIIVVSSEDGSQQVAHALEIGATDFVVKPPFRYQFEEKMAEYLQTGSLPERSVPVMQAVNGGQLPAKVSFQMSIQEVNPLGFTLLSTHLIKKGASFWLSGEMLEKIVPSTESLFVTVLGSATQLTGEQRLYQVRVEVDPSQEQIVRDLKAYLNEARMKAH